MRRHRFDFLQKTLVSFCAVMFFASCSHVGKNRTTMTPSQTQVVADILASVMTGPVSFQSVDACHEALATLSKTEIACAVVLRADGTVFSEYTRTNSTIAANSLADTLKRGLPKLRSAYASDLGAYVIISPIEFDHQPIAYVAMAQKANH